MHKQERMPGRLVGLSNALNRPKVADLDDLYDHIFASIVDQRLPPGTKLTEALLCEIFNVGRRQIGQMLSRLAQEGLVTLHANRGAFVASPDVAEARAIFGARRAIEAEITRLVALEAPREKLALLKRNVEDEAACRRQNRTRDVIRLSGAFHILLGDLGGNPILAGMVRQLVARTSLVVSLYENQNTMSCWHDDHRNFIKLLEARRAPAAVAFMQTHLSHVEESLDFAPREEKIFDLRAIYAPRLA